MTIQKSQSPKATPVTSLDLPKILQTRINGQIPVILLSSGNLPITRMDFIYHAGSRYQTKAFRAFFTNLMLPEGTRSHSAHEIAEMLDHYGSFMLPYHNRDQAGLTLYSLNKHLESSLRIIIEVLEQPRFREEELDVLKQNHLHQLAVEETQVEFIARKQLTRALFGAGHPYGMMGESTDIQSLNSDELKQFHSSYYKGSNLSLLITSDRPQTAFEILDHHFRSSTVFNTTPPKPLLQPVPPNDPAAPGLQVIKKTGPVQAAIYLGKPLFSRTHKDFQGMSILVTLLGGYFGSRLMQNIREEKGYTYGISAMMHSYLERGFLMISATVDVAYWKQTLAECRKELEKLCHEKTGKFELETVRNYLSGELQRNLDGMFNQANLVKTLWAHQLDEQWINDYLDLIHHISANTIQELACQYLDPGTMIEVAVTPDV
ncbi:MAG: insulinase family protein [Bacteroidales bacterium]|nr:insulinase family protein [Bacteroidales bacterium]